MAIEHFFTTAAYLETGLGRAADTALVNIIMAGVTAAPLLLLPFFMKAIGGIAEKAGAITQNRGKGIFDRTRNAGKAASAGQKKYWGRKGTEWAAQNYNPRKGFTNPKNIASMAVARKMGFTRRQQIGLGSSADKYEGERLKEAESYLSQRGISDQKEALLSEAANEKNDFYTRMQAAKMAADAGAVYQLEDLYNGSQNVEDAQGNAITYGDTEMMRKIAAKAATKSSKVGQQNTAFSDQAMKYDTLRTAGATDGAAVSAASSEREKKIGQKATSAYIMNQKVDKDRLRTLARSVDAQQGAGTFGRLLQEAQNNPTLKGGFGKTHQELLTEFPPPPPPATPPPPDGGTPPPDGAPPPPNS